MLILERLAKAIRSAATYYADAQAAPACILWPDADRQWETVLSRLQAELPELYVLGPYDPAARRGPAIWLRCVLAGKLPAGAAPLAFPNPPVSSWPPILYLPGYSRQDLRAVDSCPDPLKQLAELQFRGAIWSQVNARDWTVYAFLKSDQGGMGLDVAADQETKSALQLALHRLLEEDVTSLQGRHLAGDYFHELLTGDPVRTLLQWINGDDQFRQAHSAAEWQAFVGVAKSQFGLDPAAQGVLAAAERLAAHAGVWGPVWERFCEAPKRYRKIPEQIQRCTMPPSGLFSSAASHGGWPQWNVAEESALRQDLLATGDLPEHQARARILELEKRHGERRGLVWAALGEAPLALALAPLAAAAAAAAQPLANGLPADLAAGYRAHGWHVDAGMLGALAVVSASPDVAAVTAALRAFYLPWAEASARYLQKVVADAGYPGDTSLTAKPPARKQGDCYLFVDGLRYDLAQRLAARLRERQCQVTETPTWAALPSVTATGKPAVTPVRNKITGQEVNVDFEPCVAESGQSLKGGYVLPKLLAAAGWQVLDADDLGNGQGTVWAEYGDIDHEGHDRGWKLAKEVDRLIGDVDQRVWQLLASGWETVQIVTDHGWLLFPGGLPKVDLPAVLADNKWGRCAAIKSGAVTAERLFPWYWNPNQMFALADGVSCFRAGMEYAHGGLSLQECLTLRLSVSLASAGGAARSVGIAELGWKRLRCAVQIEGDGAGLQADIRTQPGNPASSIAVNPKSFNQAGVASLVVEDENLAGTHATVVVVDAEGRLLAQAPTTVGGD